MVDNPYQMRNVNSEKLLCANKTASMLIICTLHVLQMHCMKDNRTTLITVAYKIASNMLTDAK